MQSKPLIIGYDASVTLTGKGGIARYTLELLRTLITEGGEDFEFVVLLNSLRGEPGPRHHFLFESPNAHPVRRRLPGPFLVQSWRRMNRPSWEMLTRRECHLVHSPASYIPPAKAPRLVTVHDLGFLHDEKDRDPLGGGYFLKAFPEQLGGVQRIITPSEYVAKDITEHYNVEENRITPVASGLTPVFFGEEEELTPEERKRFGISGDYVLTVSDRSRRKRPWMPAETWRAFGRRDVQLVALGVPPEWCTPEMVALPRVTDRELARLYRSARAVLLTTREEGFGFPLLEAMACGTPVVCAQHSALAEIGGDLPCYATKESAKGYAKALAHVIERPPNEAWRLRAVRHARRFTWERTAKRMLELYQEEASAR